MKNGYYLSAFICINELSYLTNLGMRGDQNISLWYLDGNDVKLVHYWELERITGIKNHNQSFYNVDSAKRLINELLGQYNLQLSDMEGIWGTPQLSDNSDYSSLEEFPAISYHSLTHLFSAMLLNTDLFYGSKVLGLALDGGPDMVVDKKKDEKSYYSGCYVEYGKIIDVFPVCSPGPLWLTASTATGLREGTLMALEGATDGELCNLPLVVTKPMDLGTVNRTEEEVLEYISQVNKTFDNEDYINFDDRFSAEENKLSMLMKEINKKSREMIDEIIEDCIVRYRINPRETYLAMSGGFGLNCPTNSYIMNKYKFKGFMAPPCINDSGLSLGIALYMFYKKLDRFNFLFKNAFYGNKDIMSSDDIKKMYGHYIRSISCFSPEDVVEDIVNEPVVWFYGSAEIGPRALGHRSILADPRNIESKNKLNEIKQRQWWRPVAPIILEEELDNWFENAYETPYMLHTFKLKKDKRMYAPAIEHLDLSCRVQSINKEQEPLLYQIIKKMNEEYKVPIICNTSLNDKGEPIIDTIDQTMNFALRKHIGIVYINELRIELMNHSDYKEEKPSKRKYINEFNISDEEKKDKMEELNPYGVPQDQLAVYLFSDKLYERYSLKNKNDIRMIRLLSKIAKNKNPNIEYGVVQRF